MEILLKLNDALKDSDKAALELHKPYNQPIIYRDNQNRLVDEYSAGNIVIVKDYNSKG